MAQNRDRIAGLSVLNNDIPQALAYFTRPPRASKLGQSLYCIQCRRVNAIEQFPENHHGICDHCLEDTENVPPPQVFQSDQIPTLPVPSRPCTPSSIYNTSLQHTPSKHINRHATGSRQRANRESISEPFQRNRHAVMTSSVTEYSDAGQYYSGGSTFGEKRRSQRRTHKQNRRKSLDNPTRTIEDLIQKVKTLENQLSRQNRLSGGTTNQTLQADLGSRDLLPGEGSLARIPQESHDAIRRLCTIWRVSDISELFPQDIWPQKGTKWHPEVLELFIDMAGDYPSPNQRDRICEIFQDLVRKRRCQPNSKSQYTLEDTKTTIRWARDMYSPLLNTYMDRRGRNKRVIQDKIALLQPNTSTSNHSQPPEDRGKSRKSAIEILDDEEESGFEDDTDGLSESEDDE
jgi:hypothetical protein